MAMASMMRRHSSRREDSSCRPALADGLQQAVLVTAGHLGGGEFDVQQIPAQCSGQGLFIRPRYISCSSWDISPRDSSISAMISLLLLT